MINYAIIVTKFYTTIRYLSEDTLKQCSFDKFLDHDPIVISQTQREQFRKELFSTTPKHYEEVENGKKQPPLHVFNGSEIKYDGDENGNRVLWRAQQIPNRIRRLRSRHVPLGGKLWFTASNSFSFNSRCPSSYKFDRTKLDENSRQYYFYRYHLPAHIHYLTISCYYLY